MGDLSLNFSRSEFVCRCLDPECNEDRISLELINKLQLSRDYLQRTIDVSSGCRCAAHNKAEGGSKTSSHLVKSHDRNEPRCTAADIIVVSEQDAAEKVTALLSRGRFSRLGVRSHGTRMFIHVDVDPAKPHPRLWTYDAPA